MQTSSGYLFLATYLVYFPKGIVKIPLSGDLILTSGADLPQPDFHGCCPFTYQPSCLFFLRRNAFQVCFKVWTTYMFISTCFLEK